MNKLVSVIFPIVIVVAAFFAFAWLNFPVSRHLTLQRAILSHCHIPHNAAATCNFFSSPDNLAVVHTVTPEELAGAIEKLRRTGKAGLAESGLVPRTGRCMIVSRAGSICVTAEDLSDQDLKNIIEGLKRGP